MTDSEVIRILSRKVNGGYINPDILYEIRWWGGRQGTWRRFR